MWEDEPVWCRWAWSPVPGPRRYLSEQIMRRQRSRWWRNASFSALISATVTTEGGERRNENLWSKWPLLKWSLCCSEFTHRSNMYLFYKPTHTEEVQSTWLAPGVPSSWLPSNMCSGLVGWEKLTWPSVWLINSMASQPPAARSGWELENCILSSLEEETWS